MVIATINGGATKKDWQTTIKVNERDITFKIDTGAQCNVMSKESYDKVSQQPLRKSMAKLVTFGGHRINPLGRAAYPSHL